MIVAVIMAGGSGTRFWPKSRRNMPKQCLPITSKTPMIKETIERISQLIPEEHIFISTGENLKTQIARLLPTVNYVIEPTARGTAACIGLSALHVMKKFGDAVMFIETADHFYKNVPAYLEHIKKAAEIAEHGKIALLGIKPTHPHTGFGYIKQGAEFSEGAFLIGKFREKPDLETARKYLESGDYLWNSGMFIAKCSVMLNEIAALMPELHEGLIKIKESNFDAKIIKGIFQDLKSVSIDYGVMEKSKNTVVLQGNFHWDDIGDWDAMERVHEKNADGNIIISPVQQYALQNVHDSTIIAENQVAAENISSLIIVDTKDSILLCAKNRSQEVKKIVEMLEKEPSLLPYAVGFNASPSSEFIGIDATKCEINSNCLVAAVGVHNLIIEKNEFGVLIKQREK